MTDDEPELGEHESRAVDRLIFFSDAVTAIAITLLAIDLPPPGGTTAAEFWSSVRQNDLSYLAFLVSFVSIAAAWGHHHDVFQYAKRTDSRLRTLNMFWLLMIVLITFATKLLTTNGQDTLGANALRWGFYALVQVLTSAALFAMRHHMISHHLQEPGTEAKDGSDWDWRAYGPMLGFGLSIPVFFVTPYAWVLWIVMPLLVPQLRRLQRRDQPGPAEPTPLPRLNLSRLAWGGRGTTRTFTPVVPVLGGRRWLSRPPTCSCATPSWWRRATPTAVS